MFNCSEILDQTFLIQIKSFLTYFRNEKLSLNNLSESMSHFREISVKVIILWPMILSHLCLSSRRWVRPVKRLQPKLAIKLKVFNIVYLVKSN